MEPRDEWSGIYTGTKEYVQGEVHSVVRIVKEQRERFFDTHVNIHTLIIKIQGQNLWTLVTIDDKE